MENRVKVIVKVNNLKGQKVWRHFCYAPSALVLQFENTVHKKLSDAVLEWAERDAGIAVTDSKSLKEFKDKIKDIYCHRYPDMFLGGDTDSQGWTRLWVVEHIKEELKHAC
jgi:hypothetical protein